jgi:hypothetical protein
VDRIVQDRLARAKAEPPADYEELKKAKEKLDELEKANQTELEKATARAEEAERALERTTKEAREIRLRAALLAEAGKAERRVVDPEAVVQLLDHSTLDIAEDGTPTNAATAVDALLEKRPYLVAQQGGRRSDADQGARGKAANQLTEADLASMGPEEIVKARKEGRLTELGVAP